MHWLSWQQCRCCTQRLPPGTVSDGCCASLGFRTWWALLRDSPAEQFSSMEKNQLDLSAKVLEGLADQERSSVTTLVANTQWPLRQALAAAMGFGGVGVLKLPAPRSEVEKVGFTGYVSCWECSAHTNISRMQGAGAGSDVCAGPVTHGPEEMMESGLKWPRHVATCRPLGLCRCLPPRCRASFCLWQHIPGPASCSGGCLCNPVIAHRPSQRPVLHPADPPDLSQAGRGVSRAWFEWLSSASSVRPRVWELAGLKTSQGDCQVLTCSFILQLIRRQRELGVNEAGCGFRQVRIA